MRPLLAFLVGHYERAGALARYCRRPLTALRLDPEDNDDPIELAWFRWNWERGWI